MADKRAGIRMSEVEIWAFLEDSRNLQVATLNRDGSPHLSTLWFAVDAGTIVFDTYKKSQKAVNVGRDPRVSVLVEAGDSYAELRGVSINGIASLVDDEDESVRLKATIGQRYAPGKDWQELVATAQKSRGKRAVLRVRPTRIVSWDHRKLR
tara:strand:- start:1203 stop:1658 length:456 start_codon:yes stop_codon:yes gene_type:complete